LYYQLRVTQRLCSGYAYDCAKTFTEFLPQKSVGLRTDVHGDFPTLGVRHCAIKEAKTSPSPHQRRRRPLSHTLGTVWEFAQGSIPKESFGNARFISVVKRRSQGAAEEGMIRHYAEISICIETYLFLPPNGGALLRMKRYF